METYVKSLIHFVKMLLNIATPCEPGSSVGIATDYGLEDPGFESQSAFSRETGRVCSERS